MKRPARLFLPLLALTACAGPDLPVSVSGEPACPPYESAGEKMRGGLKHPVRLRVLAGERALSTHTLFGRVSEQAAPLRFLLPDDDAEYTLEWSQCPNERAPAPASADTKERPGKSVTTKYECGEGIVYAKVQHATKKGDAATRTLPMAPPPDAACWSAVSAPASAATAVPSAAAPEPSAAAPESSAPSPGAPSLSAAPAASAVPSPSAAPK
jgi:hypothetical protein